MTGKLGMSIPYPTAGGSAGRCMSSSARPSVLVGPRCNPAVTRAQVLPTSGFHARRRDAVSIASSTRSGVVLETKIIPANRVNCFTLCAESSLCGARFFPRCLPVRPPGNGRPFFRGDA